MTSYLTALVPDAGEPGACLMIARRGEVKHLECRGMARLSTSVPIAPETNFRLASISKQFTAAMILLLRERGDLRLDEPLQTFFPGIPQHGGPVTLRHLLQHTSGLLDYEDHLPPDLDHVVRDHEVLEIACGYTRCYFAPGTEFRYSNTGYALLACVVEQVSGRPYAEALERMIFHPLCMKNTVALDTRYRPEVPHRAFGHRRLEDGSFVEADQSPTSSVLGDGGIYCSATDYLLWDRALWEGTLLPRSVVREMMTAGELTSPGGRKPGERVWFPADMNEPGGPVETDACTLAGGAPGQPGPCAIPYGMGWRLETNDAGLAVAYHPGSTTGFMHCVRRIPEKELTILVLTNRNIARSKELAREIETQVLLDG